MQVCMQQQTQHFAHFGSRHARALVRLVGSEKLGSLINELIQNVGIQLHTVMKPYVRELMKVPNRKINFCSRPRCFLFFSCPLDRLSFPGLFQSFSMRHMVDFFICFLKRFFPL